MRSDYLCGCFCVFAVGVALRSCLNLLHSFVQMIPIAGKVGMYKAKVSTCQIGFM